LIAAACHYFAYAYYAATLLLIIADIIFHAFMLTLPLMLMPARCRCRHDAMLRHAIAAR